jgi:hypothetical protein
MTPHEQQTGHVRLYACPVMDPPAVQRSPTPHRSPSLILDMGADRASWGAIPSAILATVSSQYVMCGTGDGDVRSCCAGARTG